MHRNHSIRLMFAKGQSLSRINQAVCWFYSGACTAHGSITQADKRSAPATRGRHSATLAPDLSQVELDELHLFHGGRRFAPRDPIERTTAAQEDSQQEGRPA